MSQTDACLIVAAGKGTRLKAHGDSKPLIDLCGMTLIERAMVTAQAAGVKRFVIITGYAAAPLSASLDQIAKNRDFTIETVFNPDYEKPNGLSVLAGAELLPERFYLTMCDHVVEPALYGHLSEYWLADGEVALGVDYRLNNEDVDLDDVTRVKTNGNKIENIGKDLANFDGFDTGVFHATHALFTAIRKSRDATGDASISGGMKMLAAENKAIAVNMHSARWMDVDSPAIYKKASNWLAAKS